MAILGVAEIIFGVDDLEKCTRFWNDFGLSPLHADPDHSVFEVASGSRVTVRRRGDADGSAHFFADDGQPLGLRAWAKRPVISQPDPVNAPGHIVRLNQHCKWRRRAYPKTINHVVFFSDDYVASFEFYRDRLGFRMSDHSPRPPKVRPSGVWKLFHTHRG
jgi:catechol 2,3-dioxygenase-like lactoylglutathione lyase family enzyme